MDSAIVQECSGIVVDELQDYKVLAMPYRKMFSTTSEPHAIPKLDFESCTLLADPVSVNDTLTLCTLLSVQWMLQ
jgi:hypothetical protein